MSRKKYLYVAYVILAIAIIFQPVRSAAAQAAVSSAATATALVRSICKVMSRGLETIART